MGGMVSLDATAIASAEMLDMQNQALDRAAFEDLYEEYLPKIYNYVCYRVGNVQAAEDITSEVFERALTHLHTYRADRGAFSTWLFRIAHNLVVNHLRDRSRQPQMQALDAVPSLSSRYVSAEQALIVAERWRYIHTCMLQLPEKQQEVLALKFGWGLDNRAIAKALRLKPNYVGVLLHRAVHALRQLVEEEV